MEQNLAERSFYAALILYALTANLTANSTNSIGLSRTLTNLPAAYEIQEKPMGAISYDTLFPNTTEAFSASIGSPVGTYSCPM